MFKRAAFLPLSVYYALIYMSVGALTSYIGLYYSSINLNNGQIGLLTSAGAVVAMLAQPAWGIAGDRAARKNTILSVSLLCSGLGIWLIRLPGNAFFPLLLCTAAFYAFQCAVNPLSDTIALELSGREGFRFSRIRTVGSLGYALMAAIAGKVFDRDISRIFPVCSLLMLASLLLSFAIPSVPGHQSGKKNIRLRAIFKNKELVFLYAFAFLIQSTMGFFYSFHAIYSKELGISTQLIGVGVMVGSFSQFPFMIFFDRIYKKLGIKNILLLSGAVHALRWLLYATALGAGSIVLLWTLHGLTYIVFYLCLAEYVNRHTADELKAGGQAMNFLVIQGVSRFFGGALGGALASALSLQAVFFACSAVCAAACAAFAFLFRAGADEKAAG